MAQLTPLAKGLITVIVLGGAGSLAWNFGLKDRFSDAASTVAATGTPYPTDKSAMQSGSRGPSLPPSATRPSATGETLILRISGSNTIGASLAPRLVTAWLSSRGATDVRHEALKRGSEPVPESIVRGTLDGMRVSVEIRAHGSADAFKELGEERTDIGMSSRVIKSEEANMLSRLGDMRSISNEHVIALDGIAVIVPPGNLIQHLARQDLARIFSGEVTEWSALGGKRIPIKVLARDEKSGTFDSFRQLVLGSRSLASSTKRFEDSAALDAAVASDPGAIGFVGLPYVKQARSVPVADGRNTLALSPTVLTVKKEDYALSRRLYLYTAAKPANEVVRPFVTFAQSEAGQQVVKEVGFVDQNLNLQEAQKRVEGVKARNCTLSRQWTGALDAYCKTIAGKVDLGTSFRFQTGSTALDNRAVQDLQRLLKLKSEHADRRITLIGFADAQGNYESNRNLSEARATTVRTALRTLGIDDAEVRGFGSEIPVADNDSPDGRERNRRVEVWVN